MKKILLLAIFLSIASCAEMLENIGCGAPSYEEKETAKSLYGDFFSSRISMNYEQGRKIFGCHYQSGDSIYSYSRLYDKGYVLVRYNKAVTYRKMQ